MVHTKLTPGDRVALVVPGSAIYVDVVLSLLVRGIIPIPLDPKLTESERTRILKGLDPNLVITQQDALDELNFGWTPGDIPLGRPMHVTSGTTGTPKGVWSGVLESDQASELVAEERDLWGFAESDLNLVISPLHHSAPLRFAMGTLLAGGRITGFESSGAQSPFDPARISSVITRERPTTAFCVPTHLKRLFSHWEQHVQPDLNCFRLLAHAGAHCPEDLKRELITTFPTGSTWEFYGSTEGQFTACPSEEWLLHPGTVGRARPGRSLRIDTTGQIWCRVPPHARFSYFNDSEKTAAVWQGDEFTVGDLGRLDKDGYLYLDGRREDLIISGGVNVYPAEVEQVLSGAPGVEDVAVFGTPSEEWGQQVCAAVVGGADVAELQAWSREHLAPAKRPKRWLLMDDLPRTSTGKVRRRDLAQHD